MSLITLTEFKALPLGLSDTILDKIGNAALQTFLDTASEMVEGYVNRQLVPGPVVQILEGNSLLKYVLREYPVISLDSVSWVDDVGQTGTHDPSLFRITPWGVLTWKQPRSGPFYRGRLYTFEYTAGYTTMPFRIKHATGLWATELMQPVYNQGAQGKPIALIELSSEQIVEMLDDFRPKGPR